MKTLSQVTLTAGDRMLCVDRGSISVFPAANTYRSKAACYLAGLASRAVLESVRAARAGRRGH